MTEKTEMSSGPGSAKAEWVPSGSSFFHSRLVEGGLERILSAVDTTETRKRIYSDHVNRPLLLLELINAHQQWIIRSDLDSRPMTRKKTQAVQSIANAARTLREQLFRKSPEVADIEYLSYAGMMIGARFMPQGGFSTFCAGLEQLIACAEHCADPKYVGSRLPRGLTMAFVSEILPGVYKRNFSRNPGFSQAGGPYVRFAVAVMKEMGKEISKSTVIAAIKEHRSGKGPGYRRTRAR
jgi:hypothetical protein